MQYLREGTIEQARHSKRRKEGENLHVDQQSGKRKTWQFSIFAGKGRGGREYGTGVTRK